MNLSESLLVLFFSLKFVAADLQLIVPGLNDSVISLEKQIISDLWLQTPDLQRRRFKNM